VTFAHPHLLWLLVVPAACLLAAALVRARASVDPHPKITRATLFPSGLRLRFASLAAPRPVAAGLALALLALALARPQGATLDTPSFTEARDVLVAVDVSRSMLADDVAPNRLDRARLLVRNLADELRGERLGLLPFAGTAFLQSPLSADYEIFRDFLDELGPDMIPAGGSDFAALLRTADEAFGAENATPDGPEADRYLVVLSDGEADSDTWRPLAEKLARRGVRVLALGLGTAAGTVIPDAEGGLVKDARGAAVLSRLQPATLQDLARLTDGAYRDASAWVDLPALLRETVARGRATRVALDRAPRREELFAWFLAPALLLLGLALIREFPAPAPVSTRHLRSPVSAALLALLLLPALAPRSVRAAEPAAAPDPLVALVDRLAAAPGLAAQDYARLATLTAELGEQARTAGQPTPPEGALRDALAAVAAGRAADPGAADWPALRSRLEALLTPPPRPEKPEQQNQSPQQPDQPKQPDQRDPSDSSEQSEQSEQSDPSASPKQPDQPPQSDQQSSSSDGQPSPPSTPKSPALGDSKQPSESEPPPEQSPGPSDQPSPDEPAQQAGGVSASGRSEEADPSTDPVAIDPALALPQQRLDRVRDADAPARLFQLLQEADTPPETRERAPAAPRQTW
jgi:Ca-activated chloride channel family protein